jgi:hypothetical protein
MLQALYLVHTVFRLLRQIPRTERLRTVDQTDVNEIWYYAVH